MDKRGRGVTTTLDEIAGATFLSRSPDGPRGVFDFDEAIRSAMVVDRIGNVVAFASRTKRPVDPAFVRDVGSKLTAFLGGTLRGSEQTFGALKWIHLRYTRLHVYCWLVDEGYLVFTSRSQLPDDLLHRMGTSGQARARYADLWEERRPVQLGR